MIVLTSEGSNVWVAMLFLLGLNQPPFSVHRIAINRAATYANAFTYMILFYGSSSPSIALLSLLWNWSQGNGKGAIMLVDL